VRRYSEERWRSEAEVGSESARAVHAAPGDGVGAEVRAHALPEQSGRGRALHQTQPHRDKGRYGKNYVP